MFTLNVICAPIIDAATPPANPKIIPFSSSPGSVEIGDMTTYFVNPGSSNCASSCNIKDMGCANSYQGQNF